MQHTAKFNLPTGTTNRHQWHKKAMHAINTLAGVRVQRKELYGIIGGEALESIVSIMFGDTENPTAEQLLNDIGEEFGWSLTKENANNVEAAALKALPIAREAMPVDDNRRTVEQIVQRNKEVKEQAEIYQTEATVKNEQVADKMEELKALYPWAIYSDRNLSQYARAAKNMKLELKAAFPGVKFSVTSESFSMGNSISVSWNNGPCTRTVEGTTDKYQYYIDKCTDDNSVTAKAVEVVLGQSKYVSTSRDINQTLRDQIKADIIAQAEEMPEYRVSELGWRAISTVDITGDYTGIELVNGEYVAQFATTPTAPPEPPPAPTTMSSAAHIEEHTHTKKGFQMFIVVLSERVEREVFTQLQDAAKSLGGWYSRKWRSTPCGFAFPVQASAAQFITDQFGDDTPPPAPSKPTTNRADKLRSMADKLDSQIDAKFADRLTNTPKRQMQADSARREGNRLKRTQSVLYSLAELHEFGQVPQILQQFTSKNTIYNLMGTEYENQGYYSYIDTDRPNNTSMEAAALWALLTPKTDEEKQAEELTRKIEGLQFSNIPGYFPTPDPVIDIMIDYASIEQHHSVLEPSAGSGAIADRVAPLCEVVECVESNFTLFEILTAKKHNAYRGDFEVSDWLSHFRSTYDRILMNPPFEKLQDIDHVRHAFKFLKDGGRLVSVMSPGAFFRTGPKCTKFREWIESLGGEVIDLPDGSFKESGTGVASKLLVLDK